MARDKLGNATRMIGTMVDLTGRPASVANYGLATEEPGRANGSPRLPFHALLGVARPFDGIHDSVSEIREQGATSIAQESHRLVELIDDLLDFALREASVAG